jgi:hypothetical protein
MLGEGLIAREDEEEIRRLQEQLRDFRPALLELFPDRVLFAAVCDGGVFYGDSPGEAIRRVREVCSSLFYGEWIVPRRMRLGDPGIPGPAGLYRAAKSLPRAGTSAGLPPLAGR